MREKTHPPDHPSFDCSACGEPWPCPPAKVELAALYQGDVISLGYYLGLEMLDALDQAAHNRKWGRVDDLYERFMGWMPTGEGNRNAA